MDSLDSLATLHRDTEVTGEIDILRVLFGSEDLRSYGAVLEWMMGKMEYCCVEVQRSVRSDRIIIMAKTPCFSVTA